MNFLLILIVNFYTADAAKIGVIDRSPKSEFSMKVGELVQKEGCEVVNLTPYGENDQVNWKEAISSVPDDLKIILLTWNDPFQEQYQKIVESLKQFTERGGVVILPTGYAHPGHPTLQLNKTIAGQIPEAIIIGELTERERLLPSSYYGPQMLTAIRPPRETPTQSITSPLLFSARLAKNWERRPSSVEWIQHFKNKKEKSRKIWPGLEDFFSK